MIIAKTIINNQYWLLQQDNVKIGNVEATPNGFTVNINNQKVQYKSLGLIKKNFSIQFEQAPKRIKQAGGREVHGYQTSQKVFNGVLDITQKLPLFTKTKKSKSWYAAGWYNLKQHGSWTAVHEPKLIVLQRYKYTGPFHTKDEVK